MNNVLELKGKRFVQESKKGNGGGAAINSKVVVTNNHVKKLQSKLQSLREFWMNEDKPFSGILISVHSVSYTHLVPADKITILSASTLDNSFIDAKRKYAGFELSEKREPGKVHFTRCV